MDKKPMLLVNEDLAEGVYAASGTPATPDVTYTLSPPDSWDGNKIYYLSFTNNTSRKLSTVTVTLKVTGNVTGIGGNVTGVVNGQTATVTFKTWDALEPNATVSGVYMHVTGVGDFSLS